MQVMTGLQAFAVLQTCLDENDAYNANQTKNRRVVRIPTSQREVVIEARDRAAVARKRSIGIETPHAGEGFDPRKGMSGRLTIAAFDL